MKLSKSSGQREWRNKHENNQRKTHWITQKSSRDTAELKKQTFQAAGRAEKTNRLKEPQRTKNALPEKGLNNQQQQKCEKVFLSWEKNEKKASNW